MGGVGSDIAVEASDAVLVSDDILRIPYLVYVSQQAMKKFNMNIIFLLSWNILAVVLAAIGIPNPIGGALVHNFGSVAVGMDRYRYDNNSQYDTVIRGFKQFILSLT